MKKRIAVLASGRGSNFQAVINAIAAGTIPAYCVALITDNPQAFAIERAQKAGVPLIVIDYESFPSREVYERALLAALQDPDRQVYAATIEALGKIQDGRSVEPLITALTNDSYEVRKSAAEGLVKLYASQQIAVGHKQAILAQRSTITQGRVNKNTHQDAGGRSLSDCPSDTHEDYSRHEDFGIGVRF